jgi:hypothetical protein
VNIPVNFEYFNAAVMFGGVTRTLHRNLYAALPEDQRAAACVKCGRCDEKCPQSIEISSLMDQVDAELG